MNYLEIVKNYEVKIGHKFNYDDAIKFWNALEEPFILQVEYHKKCIDKNDLSHELENCNFENYYLKIMDQFKIKALSFFNKTINNKVLFLEENKKKFIKAIGNTRIFKILKDKMVGGYYYEKYLKYKQKYLALKKLGTFAQSEGSSKNT
jgi:hypothetical protein